MSMAMNGDAMTHGWAALGYQPGYGSIFNCIRIDKLCILDYIRL